MARGIAEGWKAMLGLRVRSSAGRDWGGCLFQLEVTRCGGTYARALCNPGGWGPVDSRVVVRRMGRLSRFDCKQTDNRRHGANGQVDDAAAQRGSCRKETKRLGLDGSADANADRAPNKLSDGTQGSERASTL